MTAAAATGAGLALAALSFPALAGADPTGGPNTGPSNPGGPISQAINDFGQSLCPKLVKPGSDLATAMSQIQGNTGLTPTVTGMVTGLAIQLQCPAFMTSVANGKLPTAAVAPANGSPGGAPLLALPGLTAPSAQPGGR